MCSKPHKSVDLQDFLILATYNLISYLWQLLLDSTFTLNSLWDGEKKTSWSSVHTAVNSKHDYFVQTKSKNISTLYVKTFQTSSFSFLAEFFLLQHSDKKEVVFMFTCYRRNDVNVKGISLSSLVVMSFQTQLLD